MVSILQVLPKAFSFFDPIALVKTPVRYSPSLLKHVRLVWPSPVHYSENNVERLKRYKTLSFKIWGYVIAGFDLPPLLSSSVSNTWTTPKGRTWHPALRKRTSAWRKFRLSLQSSHRDKIVRFHFFADFSVSILDQLIFLDSKNKYYLFDIF